MKRKIIIREANISDIPDLMKIDQEIWPDFPATEEMFRSRIETFPEGQFVAVIKDQIVGSIFSQIVNYSTWQDKDFSWEEITDSGSINRTHDSSGDSIYGIGLAVKKNSQGGKVAEFLMIKMALLCLSLKLKRILLGSRIPGYSYSSKPVEEYIFSERSSGKLLDPELAFYQKYGVKPIKALPNYMKDSESLDYGVLVTWENPIIDFDGSFFEVDEVYSPFLGRTAKRLVIFLPGKGCSWYKASGGCTMCGFNQKLKEINSLWNFSSEDLIDLFSLAELLSRIEEPEIVAIYNGGSFLNKKEIPLNAQQEIAKKVAISTTAKILFIESRPEFVTEDSLSLTNLLKGKRLEVGIGLEAVTDEVRLNYIHKGFSLSSYEKALETLKSLNVGILTYVLLKPLFLSEREAIEEAVRTIRYAFSVGSDEVSLSSAFIQQGTLMERAYRNDAFRPPWLWSIIEVVRRTAHLGSVRIGSFKDEPPPVAIPHNCEECSLIVEKTFDDYNLNRIIDVFNNLSCRCKEEWLKEINLGN